MAFVGGLMPIERPRNLQIRSRSAQNSPLSSPLVSPTGSPANSRRNSTSSISSAHTDPGLDLLERLRRESAVSAKSNKTHRTTQSSTSTTIKTNDSTSSSSSPSPSINSSTSKTSAFKSLFHKTKKPKEKKDYDKIILTSRHAAAVKTKLMMENRLSTSNTNASSLFLPSRPRPNVKTAGVVGTQNSAHLSAAAQEARHPHSGPPNISRSNSANDFPMLTKIISGDERDYEEDEEEEEKDGASVSDGVVDMKAAKAAKLRQEWMDSKQPSIPQVLEHGEFEHDHNTAEGGTIQTTTESDESNPTSAYASTDENEGDAATNKMEKKTGTTTKSKSIHTSKPTPITRNSYGTRFHRDENGLWTR